MRNVRLSLQWYSVARRRQQENIYWQVGCARASPLAFSPVASQPHHFSDFPTNGEKCEMRVFRCYGTRSRAASSRRNTHTQVGSARASPLAFNPIAYQPRRFSPPVARLRIFPPKSTKNHQNNFAVIPPEPPPYGAVPLPTTKVGANCLAAMVLDNQVCARRRRLPSPVTERVMNCVY